jgi:very-short-patch-repair endonuclease
MYYGANQAIMEMAKALRKEMTHTERLLWDRLNNKQLLKVRFRRQHPIYRFIADFYCHAARLVVEVDGGIHNSRKEYDEGRAAEMERFGIKVIRFRNDDVEKNIEDVIYRIEEIVRCRLEKNSI